MKKKILISFALFFCLSVSFADPGCLTCIANNCNYCSPLSDNEESLWNDEGDDGIPGGNFNWPKICWGDASIELDKIKGVIFSNKCRIFGDVKMQKLSAGSYPSVQWLWQPSCNGWGDIRFSANATYGGMGRAYCIANAVQVYLAGGLKYTIADSGTFTAKFDKDCY